MDANAVIHHPTFACLFIDTSAWVIRLAGQGMHKLKEVKTPEFNSYHWGQLRIAGHMLPCRQIDAKTLDLALKGAGEFLAAWEAETSKK